MNQRIRNDFFKVAILSLMLVSMAACNNNGKKTTETGSPAPAKKEFNFDQLLGTWQSEDGKDFERWTKTDDKLYQSVAFTLNGKDTAISEWVKVYPENDNWIYEATVKGQNEGKAVKFTSSSLTENSVQFNNPAHDFPTDVNYTIADANTMHAFIVGPNKNGGKDTIPFNYTRVK